MKERLENLRNKIDAIDDKLVRLLNRRIEYVLKIGEIKKRAGQEIYAPDREEAVLRRVLAKNTGPLTRDTLRAIYREVMSGALSLEKDLIIAFLGPAATYSHMAAIQKFGASLKYEPLPSITDVFNEVAKGRADYGVVPIENSTEGAVTHTYDMFVESDLKVCAQILLPVRHNLIAAIPREEIRKVYSISQVIAQCRQWLQVNLPGTELIEVSSSTRAAKIVKAEPHSAAIASALAADMYGLRILEANIQDSTENVTRFLVISHSFPKPTGHDKSSIMFSVRDRVGALHDSISSFKKFKINMTKIESRPNKKKAWEYFFFADIIGHCEDAHVKRALEELAKHTMFIKILGSYPNVNG